MINQIASYWKLHRFPILILAASTLFYFVFAYHLERSDFVRLIMLYGALFFFCFKLIQFEKWNLKFLVVTGILFRLVFLIALPGLSQDYFRFIWDGEMILQGINPYLFTPDSIMNEAVTIPANGNLLHKGMGELSSRNFSNYPPLNQIIFTVSAYLGSQKILGSVIAMRVFIILADLGILYFGRKLLKNLNKSPHLIFWYFLNPLIIIELTGNLHFEGVMFFFFVWSLFLLSKKNWWGAAILLALSIQIKLVPLIFLPLFLFYFNWKKLILFYCVTTLTVLIVLWPFYIPEFSEHYTKTVGLWFSNFEFNAGLYNGLKQMALTLDIKPWHLIKTYGKITPFIVAIATLIFARRVKNEKLPALIVSMLWVLSIYYFLSTTVHPWYIISLVVLTLFSEYRFPLVWSAMIFLSYSAYGENRFEEQSWLLAIEYFVVFGFMIYEIIRYEGSKLIISKN
ncbi:MAG: glycosyltransferase family 87 protein [Flavobacteriaceae bacterium]